jgi:CRP-like cAMP-binding protein
MGTTESYEQAIIGFPLFKGYTSHGAAGLLKRGEIRTIAKGEVLFREGDVAQDVMLLLRGTLTVFVERDGREVRLTDQGPGTILGELGVLCGLPRSASARAHEDTVVLQWGASQFRSLLLSDPMLSERIFRQSLRTLVEKEQSMIAQITQAQRKA